MDSLGQLALEEPQEPGKKYFIFYYYFENYLFLLSRGGKGVHGDFGATGLFGLRGNKGARGDILYVSRLSCKVQSSR